MKPALFAPPRWLMAITCALAGGLIATHVWAAPNANCSSLLPFCFSANTPAIADDINNNFKKVADFTVPVGGIIMWTGANVPPGWALCNGQSVGGVTTPDLRGKFVVGSTYSAAYPLGASGGADSVTLLKENLPPHAHSISGDGSHSHNTFLDTGGGGSTYGNMITGTYCNGCLANYALPTDAAGTHAHGGATGSTGDNKSFDARPPYYVIAYIMKTN